jgi:DNA-directed RNA polymerase specialized sigma24 family protein
MFRNGGFDVADERQIEDLYNSQVTRLTEIAVTQFKIPPAEAAQLAHDVMLSTLHHSSRIQDLTAWLTGAIHYASRHYLRSVQ